MERGKYWLCKQLSPPGPLPPPSHREWDANDDHQKLEPLTCLIYIIIEHRRLRSLQP